MTASVRFAYEGPGVENGLIDIEDLGPALIAMGRLFHDANQILNGDRVEATVRVKAFQPGSFGVELLLESAWAAQITGHITNAKELVALLTGIGSAGVGLFELLRKLKGEKPKRVENEKGKVVVVITGDNNHVNVDARTLDLARDRRIRQSVRAVAKPLHEDGIQALSVRGEPGTASERVEKKDLPLIEAEPDGVELVESPLDDQTIKIWLGVVKAAFDPKLSWMFSEGDGHRFEAKVPQDFAERVKSEQVQFGRGDRIYVEMRVISEDRGGDLRLTRQIVQVLKLHSAGRQKTFDW